MSAAPVRTPNAACGFTLLEILVVMVIAVAALGLVAPRFVSILPGVELKAGAREIASALRYARGRAIATRSEIAVVIDVDEPSYRIEGVAGARKHGFPKPLRLRLLTGNSELRDGSVGTISFFPDGSSTGGQVTLSSGERMLTVDVLWLTGKVSIVDA